MSSYKLLSITISIVQVAEGYHERMRILDAGAKGLVVYCGADELWYLGYLVSYDRHRAPPPVNQCRTKQLDLLRSSSHRASHR